MATEAFTKRGRALEEQFFQKVNRELAEKLKKSMEDEASRKALASSTGIHDEELLQKLVEVGVSTESLAALSLAPLVIVAWADENVDVREIRQINDAATGIEEGNAAHQLLTEWLTNKPQPELFATWKGFISAVLSELDDNSAGNLKKQIEENCQKVAKASGGSLGTGKVSPSEKRTLDEIHAALNE